MITGKVLLGCAFEIYGGLQALGGTGCLKWWSIQEHLEGCAAHTTDAPSTKHSQPSKGPWPNAGLGSAFLSGFDLPQHPESSFGSFFGVELGGWEELVGDRERIILFCF